MGKKWLEEELFSYRSLLLNATEIFLGFCSVCMVDMKVHEKNRNMPLLKGRATVDMKVKVKDNPNMDECVFQIVMDEYNATLTAGNFVDLVERHFYEGMENQIDATIL
ncbi:Peptidyl-prolyl cis-trans isomerase cyp38 protein [Thalictrum thalictroides]|uniref:peptidylprolyl isomerase n=1 Tax=Thalictrum thalictroides TaxID=46969 RepID=A0A7J6W1T1_THATH|nr:Peptidyl-prolyl cis-trans isomerase cyp38 protein [Thalictrum thalictroides]